MQKLTDATNEDVIDLMTVKTIVAIFQGRSKTDQEH